MYNNQQPYYDYDSQYHYQQSNNNGYQHDAYAMNDMTHNNRQPVGGEYAHYEEPKPTPSTSEGYYTPPPTGNRSSQVGISGDEKYARRNNRDKRSCCDMICCGCCTCCPRWCRWLLCIIFLIIVALGIVIGVLAALFKSPSVDFMGIQGTPAFGLVGTNVNLNVSLGFVVKNPNIESVTFSTLTATAYYHGDTTALGGGTLNDLHIGSHSVTNISFPFDISMDVTNSQTLTIVNKMMSDCGLAGGTAKDINLDYKVVATVKIVGIPISIPYSSSVAFKCPLDSGDQSSILNNIQSILGGILGGGASGGTGGGIGALISAAGNAQSLIPTGLLPSGTSIPTGLPDLANIFGGGSR